MVEAGDLRDGPAVALTLGDLEVGVGVGRDLWQVRDAQDLVAAPKRPQPPSEGVAAATADAGVHFVEHERRASRPRPRALP